jgi:hypothetical protein
MSRGIGKVKLGSMGTLPHAVPLAVPALHGDCVDVFCDDHELARIQNGRYFSVRLDPGKHSFKSTDEKSAVDLDVKAGQTYYIRGEVVPVKLKPRGKLIQMSTEQGNSEAHTLKPIDSSMVKDSDRVVLDPLK